MPKRDAAFASLPSPRLLRMDEWSAPMTASGQRPNRDIPSSSSGPSGPLLMPLAHDIPTGHGYGSAIPPLDPPLPASNSSNSWHLPASLADPLQKKTRIVHSFAFKVITDGPPDAASRDLTVTEADADGDEKPKNLEHFFYGIVGHVKDVWGKRTNGWKESSRLANYWRKYFHIPEVPYSSWFEPSDANQQQAEEPDPLLTQDEDIHEPMEDPTSTSANPPSLPVQIQQLAYLIYDAMIQQPETNADILSFLRSQEVDPATGHIQVANAKTLSHLSAHLAIQANILAQVASPDAPLEDDDHGL